MSDQGAQIYDRRDQRQYPCQDHVRRIDLTEQSVASLKQTNEGITTKLDLILAQVTSVALLEEKHSTAQADIVRAHNGVRRLDDRYEALSVEVRAFMNRMKG